MINMYNYKRIRMILLCILLSVIFSACGNGASSEKEVKLVGTPKSDTSQSNTKEDQVKKQEVNNLNDQQESTKTEVNKTEVNKTVKASSSSEKKVTIPKIEYKLSNRIIVLDPGHAAKADLDKEPVAPNSNTLKYKQTGGAEGVSTKTPEYKVNMNVALKLKNYLEQEGFQVIMTKTDNSKTLSNIKRAEIGNEAGAGLVIRIHADSSDNKSARGASMLVPENNENTKDIYKQSKAFGQAVLATLINEVGMKNRGVVERSDMTGFNWSKVPVILVEMGFLSNSEEDKMLSDSAYQDKIAKAIAKGVAALEK